MRKKTKYIFLCAFLFCFHSHSSEIQTNLLQVEELAEVKFVLSGHAKNVHFVKVFDGIIPVPNRYTLIASESSRHEFYGSSNQGITKDLYGHIVFGNYKKDAVFLKKLLPSDKHIKERTNKYELQVILYELHLSSGIDGKYTVVLIHDESDYMVVSDSNNKLWVTMLFVYSKSKLENQLWVDEDSIDKMKWVYPREQ